MSINKTFGDKLTISLKGRNLLDPEYRQTYTFKDVEYDFKISILKDIYFGLLV